MAKYIDRNKLENFAMNCVGGAVDMYQIHNFPTADVVSKSVIDKLADKIDSSYRPVKPTPYDIGFNDALMIVRQALNDAVEG